LHPPKKKPPHIQDPIGESTAPMNNVKLTQSQTQELKAIWAPIRRNQLVEDRKSAPIWIKLGQSEARMSHAQLYACATILADLELEVPHFVLDILYGGE